MRKRQISRHDYPHAMRGVSPLYDATNGVKTNDMGVCPRLAITVKANREGRRGFAAYCEQFGIDARPIDPNEFAPPTGEELLRYAECNDGSEPIVPLIMRTEEAGFVVWDCSGQPEAFELMDSRPWFIDASPILSIRYAQQGMGTGEAKRVRKDTLRDFAECNPVPKDALTPEQQAALLAKHLRA